jgi:alkylated DNA repair dioxygenase AlkB
VSQLDLFAAASELPEGFVYRADFISAAEEQALVRHIERIDYAEIRMHGVVAKRRAAHFGRDYNYGSGNIDAGEPIPPFLLPLRERVAEAAGRKPEEFAEVLVTEYPAGAGIGWHRDAPAFDIVVGVSLLSACTMQFRPWPVEKGSGSKPLAQVLDPRSLYILQGSSRTRWQHHIPEAKERRYSVTLRTLRGGC